MAAGTAKDDLIAQLSETWASIGDLCRTLDATQWATPTACPGWTVHDQIAHIVGTESMLAGREAPDIEVSAYAHVRNDIGKANERWVESRRSTPDAVLLGELHAITSERLDQLAKMPQEGFDAPSWTPAGQGTYGRFMQIRVFDCWVHEQDIRVALGIPGHESGPAAEQSVDEIVRALGYIVGKKAQALNGSRVRFELTGPLFREITVVVNGRARVLEPFEVEPTGGDLSAVVSSGSTCFVRLCAGRMDPDDAIHDERVRLKGDLELGRRIVAALLFVI